MSLPLWPAGPGYPAQFSPCRTYRYVLWRQWSPGPYLMVVGLNPSTADEQFDDPTLRRCIAFAKREGMGALCMTNVYAFRATDPKDMLTRTDALGPANYRWLAECAQSAELIICAWGKHAKRHDRQSTLEILRAQTSRVMCLGRNLDGTPKHPLYLAGNAPLIPYEAAP